jgi:BetI-type transcriptional repressor, C-terminal
MAMTTSLDELQGGTELDEGEQEDSRFRADVDPETFADEITAMVNGVADHALRYPDRWPADEQLAFLDRQLAPVLHADPVGVHLA